MVNFDGNPEKLRAHLYKEFGAGTSGNIHTKEGEYDAGLPEKGQIAFPSGVDMRSKLRQLKDRQQLFWRMCAPELRPSYPYCQEPKLIRIVLEHVDYNPDYKECVARMLNSVSLRKEIANDIFAAGSNDSETGDLKIRAIAHLAMSGFLRGLSYTLRL